MVSKKNLLQISPLYIPNSCLLKSVNYEYEYEKSKVYSMSIEPSDQLISYVCIYDNARHENIHQSESHGKPPSVKQLNQHQSFQRRKDTKKLKIPKGIERKI